jgi:hypothetical protein
MCECKQRADARVARRARRCFGSAACYDTPPTKQGAKRAASTFAATRGRRLGSTSSAGTELALRSETALAETTCKASDKKTRSRQATCRSPDALAARTASGVAMPVLLTRHRLQGRSSFSNEEPFNVSRAFRRYHAQLPDGPGSFSGSAVVRRHWPAACDTPKCASCAAVGASGTLLSHTQGELIDNHTVVLCANWLKLKGTRSTSARARR